MTSTISPRSRAASTRTAADERAHQGPPEAELLRRIADGDGAAYGLLSDRLTPVLRRTLHRLGLTPADVDDVAQDTMVSVWRNSATFRGQASVSTWACRIALNQAISIMRRQRRPLSETGRVAEDPAAAAEANRRASEVRAAVLALPPKLRTVIVLREFEDRAYREIAEILEIPVGTVMSRLHQTPPGSGTTSARRLRRGPPNKTPGVTSNCP